jgi:hypothetical protein
MSAADQATLKALADAEDQERQKQLALTVRTRELTLPITDDMTLQKDIVTKQQALREQRQKDRAKEERSKNSDPERAAKHKDEQEEKKVRREEQVRSALLAAVAGERHAPTLRI